MAYCVGLDIGYSNLKVQAGERGSPSPFVLPAGAGPKNRLSRGLLGDSEYPEVLVDGTIWVGGVEPGQIEASARELHEDYAGTDAYRALALSALSVIGRDHVDHLVTGLPVDHYGSQSRRQRLQKMLTGQIRLNHHRQVYVHQVTVLPQPAGAFMDQLASLPAGDLRVLREGKVVVLDPGFYSVDWVILEGGNVRASSSGTSQQAMSTVLENAAKQICSEHGKGAVTPQKLESAIRQGRSSVLAFGQELDFRPYLDSVREDITHSALSSLRSRMRDQEDSAPDMVILTGGGARAYQRAAREAFPNSRLLLPDHPVTSNAKGFWEYAVEHAEAAHANAN